VKRLTHYLHATRHKPSHRKGVWATLILGAGIVAACASARSSRVETRHVVTDAPGGVAILALEPFELGAKSCDPEKTAACVRRAIVRQRRELRVVPREEFSRVAYPGLAVSEAPSAPEHLVLLLEDADFRAQIEPLGLRYVVVVGGLTSTRKLWGGIFCGGGYGGAGCLGLEAAEHETRMAATVFDVERIGRRREVTASDQDREYLAIFVIFPFFKPAATMSGACRNVAAEILRAMDELASGPEEDRRDASGGWRP